MPEVKLLKHFKRVSLSPGQSETVRFTVARGDLEFYGKNLAAGPIVEPGVFTVRVGTQPNCAAGWRKVRTQVKLYICLYIVDRRTRFTPRCETH
eukprot:SAG22_NODE_1922_length_3307_cov_1.973504_2_plen_94_part_00